MEPEPAGNTSQLSNNWDQQLLKCQHQNVPSAWNVQLQLFFWYMYFSAIYMHVV